MRRDPRPAQQDVRIARALRLVQSEAAERRPHPYRLSAGRFDPRRPNEPPWTVALNESIQARYLKQSGADLVGLDCSAFVKWCCKLVSRRPGFNAGGSVVDQINSDSLIEDARGEMDLTRIVDVPRDGDLIAYPSIRGRDVGAKPSGARVRVGHIGLIVGYRGAEWDPVDGWGLLDVAQCGSTTHPAVSMIDGRLWQRAHRTRWGDRPEWGGVFLRFVDDK